MYNKAHKHFLQFSVSPLVILSLPSMAPDLSFFFYRRKDNKGKRRESIDNGRRDRPHKSPSPSLIRTSPAPNACVHVRTAGGNKGGGRRRREDAECNRQELPGRMEGFLLSIKKLSTSGGSVHVYCLCSNSASLLRSGSIRA